jgi:hypothetical protein
MSTGPSGPVGAAPAPSGVTPDFEDPQDAGWVVNIAVMILCDVLITFFFAVRSYVKMATAPRILAEDCTSLAAASWQFVVVLIVAWVMGRPSILLTIYFHRDVLDSLGKSDATVARRTCFDRLVLTTSSCSS